MRKLTICLLLTTLALPALADSVIFSCTTTNKKAIRLTQQGNNLKYEFGSPGKSPDIAVSVPRSKAEYIGWSGVGRAISYSVTIPNGEYSYNVFHSIDRLTDEHAVEAGVNVLRGADEQFVNTVKCSNKAKIVNNIESLE